MFTALRSNTVSCTFRTFSTSSWRGLPASQALGLSELTAISGVDGRYGSKTQPLREHLSEFALIKCRVRAEIRWLQALSEIPEVKEVPRFSPEAVKVLEGIIAGFDETEAREVKKIEAVTNHDVKAVEYYLKNQFEKNSNELRSVSEFLHFACTSEDINNSAYGLMISSSTKEVLFPSMQAVVDKLSEQAHELANTPMIARTHGQPATPTTMGKEMANFAFRLDRHLVACREVDVCGKMNGAVGNYNAHVVAYPTVDWPKEARGFVESLGLTFNPYTTQIEPHDYIAELFDAVSRFNTTMIGFNRDMWHYISMGYFKQRTIADEVGSSTMPHKVNPIDFENSEGNLGLANAVMSHLSEKLPISRFQRDLSDSTVLRNIGVGFAHCLIAYSSVQKGLTRVDANAELMKDELDEHWEVLAEPVQTVLRRYGVESPYEKLKELTRGRSVDQEAIHSLVMSSDIPKDAKERLLALRPSTYTGLAADLASDVLWH